MIIIPLIGFGVLFVFFLGAALTHVLLKALVKRFTRASELERGRVLRPPWPGNLRQEELDRLCFVGGGLLVVLFTMSIFVLPRDLVIVAWVVLSILGIITVIPAYLLVSLPQQATKVRRVSSK